MMRTIWRARRRPVVSGRRLLLAVVLVLGSLVPAAAAAAAPQLTVSGEHRLASGFTQGDEAAQFIVRAQNTGDQDTSGPVTIVDHLPSGVTPTKVEGEYPATCTLADAANGGLPTCLITDPIPAGGSIAMTVTVTVDRDAPARLENHATVTGGGAPSSALSPPDIVPVRSGAFSVTGFTTSATDTDGRDVTQAGAHPFQANTTMTFASRLDANGTSVPVEHVRKLETDLPPGFVGNPRAAGRCANAKLTQILGACPADSLVGMVAITQINDTPYAEPFTYAPDGLYNIEPDPGQPATFAFSHLGAQFVLSARVRSNGDFGLSIDAQSVNQPEILGVSVTFCGNGAQQQFFSFACKQSGPETVPLLSNPTRCAAGPPATTLRVNSHEHPETWVGPYTALAHTPPANPSSVTGCDGLPFEPSVDIAPTTPLPDAPSGLQVGLDFPQEGLQTPDGLATAHLKTAKVTLPEGMTINPSAASGLVACADADLRLKSLDPLNCPEASKIGTVTGRSPVLDEQLSGGVYIRSQNSEDPASGEMFRIALALESKERGISIRLPGQIRVNPATGRIETVFDNNPQLPVSELDLRFKDGPRAPLANPPTCGPKTVQTQLTSWGGQTVTRQSTFGVSCLPGLGAFAPGFSAGVLDPTAAASAPFNLQVSRPDGHDVLDGLRVQLPTGLLANLKGNVGTQVGTVAIDAGPGSAPYRFPGRVYLEGPYGDAPFSLRVVVPAKAGPFDLGEVVVRQKIYVDPIDAHVTIVSDPVPTIVKGVPVRLRNLSVTVDKPGFMRSPSSCAEKRIDATLHAAGGRTANVASRFQVGGCAALPLKPQLDLRLNGRDRTKLGDYPGLTADVRQTPGQTALKRVEVKLPLSLALEPKHARALCKPEQAEAKACPAASIVGSAMAVTPILNRPLSGPVYFVEGLRRTKEGRLTPTFPKLWVALRGEVSLDLWADSNVVNRKLVTTFAAVPDAPISSFRLNIDGGKNGILEVTGKRGTDLCKGVQIADAEFNGQSGAQRASKIHMATPCGFRAVSSSLTATRARVKVGGLGRGRLRLSGNGIRTTNRSVSASTVATVNAALTQAGRRAYRARKAVVVRVAFTPAGSRKARTTSVSVHRPRAPGGSRR